MSIFKTKICGQYFYVIDKYFLGLEIIIIINNNMF